MTVGRMRIAMKQPGTELPSGVSIVAHEDLKGFQSSEALKASKVAKVKPYQGAAPLPPPGYVPEDDDDAGDARASVPVQAKAPAGDRRAQLEALGLSAEQIDALTAMDAQSAAPAPPRPHARSVTPGESPDRIVRVKPRQTIARMQVGPVTYSFIENVPAFVPVHVRRHLEEKGIV